MSRSVDAGNWREMDPDRLTSLGAAKEDPAEVRRCEDGVSSSSIISPRIISPDGPVIISND